MSLVGKLLDRSTDRMSYTPEEQRNVDIALEFMKVRRPLSAENMARFFHEDSAVHRKGMPSLSELSGIPNGYTPHSMPDREDDVQDIIAKGDRVWIYWHISGTHSGDFWGLPASGRRVDDVVEIAILRFEDGKIRESVFVMDELLLARQIGVSIGLPSAAARPT